MIQSLGWLSSPLAVEGVWGDYFRLFDQQANFWDEFCLFCYWICIQSFTQKWVLYNLVKGNMFQYQIGYWRVCHMVIKNLRKKYYLFWCFSKAWDKLNSDVAMQTAAFCNFICITYFYWFSVLTTVRISLHSKVEEIFYHW